ncbi:MAG: ATP-binding protein [Gammaproteobacteria bacterium]|nr:ATP-binding protein [Gammaproteobacteria bacterium]
MNETWKLLQLPAQADSLQRLRALVREQALALGFAAGCADDLALAVNEACMNVIQHGYRGAEGMIELSVGAIDGGMEIRVRDKATPVSMDDWRPRALDELRPGGLGVHFIREIMDEVAYLPLPEQSGNLLSMKKYLNNQGVGK